MVSWNEFLYDQGMITDITSAEAFEPMTEVSHGTVLGGDLVKTIQSRCVVAHIGHINGYPNYFCGDTNYKDATILLSNHGEFTRTEIAGALIASLNDEPVRLPEEKTLTNQCPG